MQATDSEQVWAVDITYLPADGKFVYQNALAERVNGIVKSDLVLQRPADLAQAKRMVHRSR